MTDDLNGGRHQARRLLAERDAEIVRLRAANRRLTEVAGEAIAENIQSPVVVVDAPLTDNERAVLINYYGGIVDIREQP